MSILIKGVDGRCRNLPLFMKDNKLLYNTRKTYHKVFKLHMINSTKSVHSFRYDTRLLKIRKLIIKWFIKNRYSILMLNVNHVDKIANTLEYGRNNYLGSLCDIDREHIYRLIEYFNYMCEEIEDFYG